MAKISTAKSSGGTRLLTGATMLTTYTDLRVADVMVGGNPGQVEVERPGTGTVWLPTTGAAPGNRDLEEGDIIIASPSTTLKVNAEDSGASQTTPIVDITGLQVDVLDWEIVTSVDTYYDDNNRLIYQVENGIEPFTIAG
jgi:hypothetical protein